MSIGYMNNLSPSALTPFDISEWYYYGLTDENGDPAIVDKSDKITNNTPTKVTLTTW